MSSKRSRRREFLKGSAALVGGLLGTGATAIGQTPASPPMIKGDKDLIAYGVRSRFVNSVRIAHGGRPSPDDFGLVFHVLAAGCGAGAVPRTVLTVPRRQTDASGIPAVCQAIRDGVVPALPISAPRRTSWRGTSVSARPTTRRR